jgi:hypothetical protein
MLVSARRIGFAALLFTALLSSSALAWNKAGHMVSGAIAFDTLVKDDPATAKKLAELLRESGLFTSKIDGVPAAQQDRLLFMYAARWPDDIRMDRSLSHPKWHYRDQAFVPPGDATQPEQPAKVNAVTALKSNLAILSAPGRARDRAVALAWIIHLTGDLHQPLHAVSEYSTVYPKGDRGGNSQFIRAQAGRAVINLHSLWDGLILGSSADRDASNMATKLEQRSDLGRSQFPEVKDLDALHSADESFRAAVKDAYLGRKLKTSDNESDGPVLPDGYLATAKLSAEKRMVLAGYRLAAALMLIDGKHTAGRGDIATTKDASAGDDPMDHESADQDPTMAEATDAQQPGKELLQPIAAGETIVHVTKAGKKYHRAGCGSLASTDLTMTLAEAKQKGLEPCGKCHPPE